MWQFKSFIERLWTNCEVSIRKKQFFCPNRSITSMEILLEKWDYFLRIFQLDLSLINGLVGFHLNSACFKKVDFISDKSVSLATTAYICGHSYLRMPSLRILSL